VPNYFINIEVKEDDPRVADLLIKELDRFQGIEHRVVVGGRYCGVIDYFRSRVGDRFATSACEKEGIQFLLLYKLHFVGLYQYLIQNAFPFKVLQIPVVSGGIDLHEQSFIDTAHSLGIQVHYWVVNNVEYMHELIDRKADGIISDRTDIVHDVFVERNIRQAHPSDHDVSQWFLPSTPTPAEVHGCVTPLCHVLQQVDVFYIVGVVLVLAAMMMQYLIQCCLIRKPRTNSKKDQ
jgi:Glycerophosphoryl diester phosphodiesterase family